MAFGLSYLLLCQVSIRRGCVGVREEVEGGNLGPSPGASLGESETPRCHLTIPLLVNPRGDSTGSRAPVSPSRAEVTCWEQLPGTPAGLSGSPKLPGFPLNVHSESRGAFHTCPCPPRIPTPITQCTALHYSHASLLTLSFPFSFSVIISWVLSPP